MEEEEEEGGKKEEGRVGDTGKNDERYRGGLGRAIYHLSSALHCSLLPLVLRNQEGTGARRREERKIKKRCRNREKERREKRKKKRNKGVREIDKEEEKRNLTTKEK